MKILFVHEKCGYFGGVEQNVSDVAGSLRDRGHECSLAYGQSTGKDMERFRSRFVEAVEWHGGGARNGNGSRPSSDGPGLESIVRRVGPDAIYFHKMPQIPSNAGSLGPRTVAMIHDHDTTCPRRHKYFAHTGKVCRLPVGLRCWGDLAFLKRGDTFPLRLDLGAVARTRRGLDRLKGLDALVVGSRFMRDELIGNGIDGESIHLLAPVPPGAAGEPRPFPEQPHVLYVGQLIRGKGVDLLLRAISRLVMPFRATIVGDGNAAEDLQSLARRLGLDGRVRFPGWVGHEELQAHYDEATVIVVPSRWPEPFGLVGIEAMRRGRPVVAFDVGGIPDWLRPNETGILVPEQDVPALATAIGRVLSDRDLAGSLGRAALERARNVYSHERYVENVELLLAGSRMRLRSSERQGAVR